MGQYNKDVGSIMDSQDLGALKELVAKGNVDDYGDVSDPSATLLFTAVRHQWVGAVLFLLESGADPNPHERYNPSRPADWRSIQGYACFSDWDSITGRNLVIQRLLRAGMNPVFRALGEERHIAFGCNTQLTFERAIDYLELLEEEGVDIRGASQYRLSGRPLWLAVTLDWNEDYQERHRMLLRRLFELGVTIPGIPEKSIVQVAEAFRVSLHPGTLKALRTASMAWAQVHGEYPLGDNWVLRFSNGVLVDD